MNHTLQHNDCYTQQYGEDNILWMQNVEYNSLSSIWEPDENQSYWHIKRPTTKFPHVAGVSLKRIVFLLPISLR